LVPERGAAMTHIETPTRTPSPESRDDTILPFEVAALDLRGRVVRLGAALDEILSRHDYPLPVAKLLGEAIALAALFGSALKFDGKFILQTQTDGPVRMLVVDYATSGNMRACARFDKKRVAAAIAAGETSSAQLLGHGHLAMTIDQGGDMSRYQGVVALEGASLEEVAHEYFRRSEQIPTCVRLAVAEEFSAGKGGGPKHRWRAGGMLLQFLPKAAERMRGADLHPGDAPQGIDLPEVADDDAWVEGRSLMETVEDLELIDPALSTEQLLFRLFHERGVRVFDSMDVQAQCSCSRESVSAMLKSFTQADRDDMVENGVISVTCEFCSETYVFDPDAVVDPAAGKVDQKTN
jgi:molecular chaperone Hsp33